MTCGRHFCHGEPEDMASQDPDPDLVPGELSMCVQLNKLISEHSVQTLERTKSEFRCPRCWDHTQGMYPVSLFPHRTVGI